MKVFRVQRTKDGQLAPTVGVTIIKPQFEVLGEFKKCKVSADMVEIGGTYNKTRNHVRSTGTDTDRATNLPVCISCTKSSRPHEGCTAVCGSGVRYESYDRHYDDG